MSVTLGLYLQHDQLLAVKVDSRFGKTQSIVYDKEPLSEPSLEISASMESFMDEEPLPDEATRPAFELGSSSNPDGETPPHRFSLKPPFVAQLSPESRVLYDAANQLLSRLGGADQIVVALNGDRGAARLVQFPKGAQKKITELLPFEIENLLPMDVHQEMLDHQPANVSAEFISVLAVVAPHEEVSSALKPWQEIGLEPKQLAFGALPLAELLPHVPVALATTVLWVNIEENALRSQTHHLDFCVTENTRATWCRTLSQESQPLAAFRASLVAYHSQGNGRIGHIVLTGSKTLTIPFSEMIMEAFPEWAASVLTFEPPVFAQSKKIDNTNDDRSAWAYPLGLALVGQSKGHSINLRKGQFQTKESKSKLKQTIPWVATGLLLLMLSYAFSVYAEWKSLKSKNEMLRAQLSSHTKTLFGTAIDDPETASSLISGKSSWKDPLPSFTALDALIAISNSISESVKHDTKSVHIDLGDSRGKGRVELQGTLSSANEVEQIIAELKGTTPCLSEIKNGPISSAQDDRKTYRLEASLECQAAHPLQDPKKAKKTKKATDEGGAK